MIPHQEAAMSRCELDHIIIGAASLADGVRFIRERLGVEIPRGGKHPDMGTHNGLMRLGGSAFLEVISIDPEAPHPGRPRWFELDRPAMQARLVESPRLISWAIRSPDIVATAQSSAFPVGEVTALRRDALTWRLTVPADGGIPGDGVMPHVIEWDGGARPWERMADLGCRLEALVIAHPRPETIEAGLRSLCARGIEGVRAEQGPEPMLSARIVTPSGGVVTL
jgi:Glyoxalase-like domain